MNTKNNTYHGRLPVREEQLVLVPLHLAMLHWSLMQMIIKLHGLVRGGTSLVLWSKAIRDYVDVMPREKKCYLRGVQSKPEMKIVSESSISLIVDAQHDERVAVQEGAVLLARPWHHLELLDAPNVKTRGLSNNVPCSFGIGCLQTSLLVGCGADQCHISVLKLKGFCVRDS